MTPDATTLDAVLGGRLLLRQPRRGPRAGLDAVFLGQAFSVLQGPVLDVGAGCGVVGLAVAARAAVEVTALEIAPELAALVTTNAAANGLSERVRVVNADALAPIATLSAHALHANSFAVVLCNPPFAVAGDGRPSDDPLREQAHAMPAGNLDRWARFWAAMAIAGGTLGLIHRADRLAELLTVLEGRFGALRLLPLYPHAQEPAHRVLVTGIKGSRQPLALMPGMVLHQPDGTWTPEAAAVLAGERLVFAE